MNPLTILFAVLAGLSIMRAERERRLRIRLARRLILISAVVHAHRQKSEADRVS
jgi:hypothetical protein